MAPRDATGVQGGTSFVHVGNPRDHRCSAVRGRKSVGRGVVSRAAFRRPIQSLSCSVPTRVEIGFAVALKLADPDSVAFRRRWPIR